MTYNPGTWSDGLANLSLSPNRDRSIAKKRSQRFTVQTALPTIPAPPLPLPDSSHFMVPSTSSSDESYDSTGAFSFSPSVQSAGTNLSSHRSSHSRTNSQHQIWQAQAPADSSFLWHDPMVTPAAPQNHPPLDYANQYTQAVQQPITNDTPNSSLLPGQEAESDELIPTALVMKNIPFSVSREQLLYIMDSLNLVAPHAFNYHYDTAPVAGQPPVFRGLAFANFRSPQESTAALHALNGYEMSGRRLRVEYKRMLRHGEKEKIEREKAIKRMRSAATLQHQSSSATLQHRPSSNHINGNAQYSYPVPQQQQQHHDDYEDYGQVLSTGTSQWIAQQSNPAVPFPTGSSFPTTSANPSSIGSPPNSDIGSVSMEGQSIYQNSNGATSTSHLVQKANKELDMNDSGTLEIYSRVLLFKDDNLRDELAFARSLTAHQRRTVHLVAQKLGLDHKSAGDGDDRYVIVYKGGLGLGSGTSNTSPNKAMSRRSTTSSANLRGKKSMPNMRDNTSQYNTSLNARKSNSDLRSANRRSHNGDRNSYQHINGVVPAVPALPNHSYEDKGVLRQPRGPAEDGKGFRAGNWRSAAETHAAANVDVDG